MQLCFFVLFRTNRWKITGYDNFQKAIENDYPIMLCTWHGRLLYASYFFKKNKLENLWAVASTHEDSELISRFLRKASINLIRGSSTRGGNNVTKKMLTVLKNPQSIVAITNDVAIQFARTQVFLGVHDAASAHVGAHRGLRF